MLNINLSRESTFELIRTSENSDVTGVDISSSDGSFRVCSSCETIVTDSNCIGDKNNFEGTLIDQNNEDDQLAFDKTSTCFEIQNKTASPSLYQKYLDQPCSNIKK